MKKFILLPLIIITLFILSAATALAADKVNLHADFDNYDLGPVSLKELSVEHRDNVTIEQVGTEKVLRLRHSVSGTIASQNMISSNEINISAEAIITFDVMNRNSDTGHLYVQLRSNDGNTADSTSNQINIIKIDSGKITYLPEMKSVTEAISTTQWAKITLIINPVTGKLTLYNNGVLKVSVDDFRSLRNWQAFDFSKTIFRFQNYVKSTPSGASPYVTDIIYDNIRIAQGTGDVFATSAKVYFNNTSTAITEAKNGPLVAKASLLNKGDSIKQVKVFFAYKSDGVLKELQAADYTLAAHETTYVPCNMTLQGTAPGDTVEIMVLEPDTLKPLMAPKVMYLRNAIETPIHEEMQYLYSQRQVSHPRVMATKADFDAIRSLVKTDPTAKAWADSIIARADNMVAANITNSSSPYYISYVVSSTNDILTMSRRVLDMMQTLGMAHQLTGQETVPSKYSSKAFDVLFEASFFDDWMHSHFLDTAEMMTAFAIGYDWMYYAFDDYDRQFIAETVKRLGLDYAKQAYDGTGGTANTGWWKRVDYNWNTVCNSGIIVAASAFADIYPDLAFELSSKAINNIKIALKPFSPHGGYAESSDYAIYAMEYFARSMQTLECTYGTDFGMANHSGLSGVGNYLIQIDGPLGINNYHDSASNHPHINTFVMSYLGKKYDNPTYSIARMRSIADHNLAPSALDLIWYNADVDADDTSDVPLDGYFAGAEVVSMRSGFDSDDLFLSAHGGEANVSHSHIDGGTFVLDMLGTRFASDIGAEGYGKEGYFGDNRFKYYRARAEGHNTLVINPDLTPGQSTNCHLPFERTDFTGNSPFAILDMTPAYEPYGAQSARRGYMLCDNRQTAVIRDEIILNNENENTVYWFMQTQAAVVVDGNILTLTKDGKSVRAEFVTDGSDTVLSYGAAEPLPTSPTDVTNASNPSFTRIYLKTTAKGSLNITVKFTPSSGDFADINSIYSLSNW